MYSGKKGKRGSASNANRRRSAKRKVPTAVDLETPSSSFVSASAKKLKLVENFRDVVSDPSVSYRIVNFLPVFTAIANVVVCKNCNSNITFTEGNRRGLGFNLIISCENCDSTAIPNCPLIDKAYELNRRIILAMRLLGVGLHGIQKFCAFMDLPRPVFHSFYDVLVKRMGEATETVCKIIMKNAAKEEQNQSSKNNHGFIVSGDGSWRKRGFSSLFGLVTLIGWCTGKVVDICVKSKYCKSCEFWKKKSDTAEYAEWEQSHAANCQSNHEGSAGKMECDAVVEMFQRSEDLYSVKYSHYIGDGDSKTFKQIFEAEPYDDLIVQKKECIDHVQKRMGTRLRNLKKNTKGLGGKGKLTAKLIDELAIYYGLAIRRNPDSAEKMRNDIWATLFHKISTDEKPQHDKCPPGKDSWCSWQKSKANGTLAEYKHKTALHPLVFDAIKPIYEELSRDDLLNRCLGGFTQNSNESFNSVVWSMAPKSSSSGKVVLDTAANMAVCIFNDGLFSIVKVMQVLGIRIGPNCYDFCTAADDHRIQSSERSLTDAAKEARMAQKSARKEQDDEDINLEGQFYGAGIAD